MSAWIRSLGRRPLVTVNVLKGPAQAGNGDPWDPGRSPLLWGLVAAILGGVASGATQQAVAVLVG